MDDFRKYATKHLGMNGMVLDDVIKSQAGYLNPYILEERQLNVTQLDVFSRLMMDRIIFLGTQVDDYTANTLQAQLLYLDSVDPGKDISIYINSPGGSVYAGLGIYDTMQFISSDVATICTGMAASMAAVLLVAGAEGKRSALPHSRVMIHQPMGGAQGQASDIEITAREIQKLKKELYTIIADHSHTDFDKVWADSDRDYWMTAQEAKEYGMIDEVLITALEKNIADFFMKNEEKMDFSAKEIAKHLFVSEASLSRFAKKCGFRGYREFIYQYEESFEEKNKELTGHTRTVLNMYQELLNKTYSLMDEAQIVRICEKLGQAKRVFVCGKGSSGLAAREMRLRFMRIGVDINSIQDPDLMRMQAVFQKEGCLVIGISISGESEDVCYLLEESKKRGADTILITGKNKDDYEDICDELVLIASRKYLDHGNVISPQFPILIMLDLIYSYYLEHDKKKKETMHDDTVRALKGERS